MFSCFYLLFIGPNPPTKQPQPTPQPQAQPTQTPTAQKHTPQTQAAPQIEPPAPVAVFNPQSLKYIPENEFSLWRPFADVMKVPIEPISDLETAILYLNSPYATLKIEALLSTQRLFAQGTPKELQTAGISMETLVNLLDSLERIWTDSSNDANTKQATAIKTMEEYWTEVDSKKRSITSDIVNDDENRNLSICRQVTGILRTLTVTRGPEVCQILAKSDYIKADLIPSCLWKIGDWELYKDGLIIFEAISSHMTTIDLPLLKWSLEQCQAELIQVRRDRLLPLAAKFPNFSRLGSFDNLSGARQAVSILITQCAQLWKSVPSHIFLHLSACLNLLTSYDEEVLPLNLDEFVSSIEGFIEIFILPTVSLLKSVRGLFECNNSATSNIDELRRILETVIYSPAFSLTDGGFLELCLQIISKCQSHQPDCLDSFNWTGIYCLMRELREFWRHSSCEASITDLGKACYINAAVSPAKKTGNYKQQQQQQLPLAILNNSQTISAVFSHPFLLLTKSLSLLSTNFAILPSSIQLDLLELAVEWNLDTPSKWGKEVLGTEKLEESLNILRDFYF